MMLGAADLTGWWVSYALGAAIVLVVAVLLILIILTARGIAAAAEDATRSLAETRDRTEVLWQVATTKQVAGELLDGAEQARRALGG
jgi:heme/copper-type cytochrome/quinol oxidase subunit 2